MKHWRPLNDHTLRPGCGACGERGVDFNAECPGSRETGWTVVCETCGQKPPWHGTFKSIALCLHDGWCAVCGAFVGENYNPVRREHVGLTAEVRRQRRRRARYGCKILRGDARRRFERGLRGLFAELHAALYSQ